ncbi:MAG TPA: TIGR04283 family arsenosugar biosynthesis glycosyltransferase [Gammaproteobacteria bacterium]|nr:TIGR04283 family arsenosugar biosynthesis glycosyltransferase [Gammaproteobacteria bacterium]
MQAPSTPLSIIIPTFNEAAAIIPTLRALQPLRQTGREVIVADGDSQDGTPELARPWADHVLRTGRGRAEQMNAGARAASGEILLFLHADSLLPTHADQLISEGLQQTHTEWGRFDVRLSGRHPLLRVVEQLMNWRSRLTSIATGDQAIFVSRAWFNKVGGFPSIPLMEDIALSRALKRLGPPLCLRARVITSSRRWEQHGIMRTILLMWRLRLAYALGADPQQLHRQYYR